MPSSWSVPERGRVGQRHSTELGPSAAQPGASRRPRPSWPGSREPPLSAVCHCRSNGGEERPGCDARHLVLLPPFARESAHRREARLTVHREQNFSTVCPNDPQMEKGSWGQLKGAIGVWPLDVLSLPARGLPVPFGSRNWCRGSGRRGRRRGIPWLRRGRRVGVSVRGLRLRRRPRRGQ